MLGCFRRPSSCHLQHIGCQSPNRGKPFPYQHQPHLRHPLMTLSDQYNMHCPSSSHAGYTSQPKALASFLPCRRNTIIHPCQQWHHWRMGCQWAVRMSSAATKTSRLPTGTATWLPGPAAAILLHQPSRTSLLAGTPTAAVTCRASAAAAAAGSTHACQLGAPHKQ